MRRRILLGTSALVLIIAGVLLLWPGMRAPRAPEARPQDGTASGGIATSGARLAGGAPIPVRGSRPRGDLTIRGQVLGPKGPVAGATVLATSSAGDDVLSELRCQCSGECGDTLLECGCGESPFFTRSRSGNSPVATATTV